MTKAFAGKAAVAKSMAANAKSNPIFGVLPLCFHRQGQVLQGASKAKNPEVVQPIGAIIDEVAEPEANRINPQLLVKRECP